MIKIKYINKPSQRKGFPTVDVPLFANYLPDLKAIKKLGSKYKSKKNIIVIGNGGSITSFHYFNTALGSKKNVYVVSTMEPDFLKDVREKCNKKDTVILAVSKSGNTVGVIEALLYFIDYPSIIIITENKKSAIKDIQEKNTFDYIEHPPIGGRYSGFTPSGLLASAIAGHDIDKIWKGANEAYKRYSPSRKSNAAKGLASFFYSADKKRYNEIFMPIYSSRLMGSKDIITQLIHESAGKDRKGQTIVAAFAPESQHHTNQRFFGGRRNMVGCFVNIDEFEMKYDKIKVPANLKDIDLRAGKVSDIEDNFYSNALHYEFIGTWEDAKKKSIPCVAISIDKVTEENVGEYLAFWHYVVVYMCALEGVNAFDQPQVESSKAISFNMRKKKKKTNRK